MGNIDDGLLEEGEDTLLPSEELSHIMNKITQDLEAAKSAGAEPKKMKVKKQSSQKRKSESNSEET